MESLPHYQKIVAAFEALMGRIKVLGLHIADTLPNEAIAISNGTEIFSADKGRLIYALQHFSPSSDIAPQQTVAYPGAVGCTEQTINLIQAVNQAKDVLREVAKTYKTACKMNPTRPVREILAKNGYGYLALKQVYRHIHYLEQQPTRISWLKLKTYANSVITVEEARKALCKAGEGEHIDIQLAKLDLLQASERLVKQRSMRCWAVNMTYYQQGTRKNCTLSTSLPIFYLCQDHANPPIIGYSKKSQRKPDTIRSDMKLEDKPFLPSIHAYRYRQAYR